MQNPTDDELRDLYAEARTIAVVGASADDSKPAHTIPRYLQRQGYRMIPVNPRGGEILGEKVYEKLTDVDVPVDVVDVFRPADQTPPIAEDAVKIGAKVLWLQEDIVNEDADRIAREGGLISVQGICIGATHFRLGLGPGPNAG